VPDMAGTDALVRDAWGHAARVHAARVHAAAAYDCPARAPTLARSRSLQGQRTGQIRQTHNASRKRCSCWTQGCQVPQAWGRDLRCSTRSPAATGRKRTYSARNDPGSPLHHDLMRPELMCPDLAKWARSDCPTSHWQLSASSALHAKPLSEVDFWSSPQACRPARPAASIPFEPVACPSWLPGSRLPGSRSPKRRDHPAPRTGAVAVPNGMEAASGFTVLSPP